MRKTKKSLIVSVLLLTGFALWTAAVCFVDVRCIGPQGSAVGFAGINQYVHNLTWVHFSLYNLTDWLGLVPIFVCMIFGILGFAQWVKRKSIRKVDHDILAMGGFYGVTIAVYLLFEYVVINYRPVLIGGILEASYPSSTTVLVMCVMPTAMLQCNSRIRNRFFRICVLLFLAIFTVFMIIGRLISGVHWFTDIVGGMLLSAGLVGLYATAGKI